MRSIFVLVYLLFLFLFTCTESFYLLLSQQVISFQFIPSPNTIEFFHNDLANMNDMTYVVQKFGHFICFFFLAALVFWAWQSYFLVFGICLAAALSTEVAQLYFSRSGRLLDVMYDLAGMFLFYILLGCYMVGYQLYKLIHNKTANRM